MTYDGEDDLFNEEFDFVDEDDSELEDDVAESEQDEEEAKEKPKPKKKAPAAKSKGRSPRKKKPAKKSMANEEEVLDTGEENTEDQPDAEDKSEAEEKAPEPPPGPPTDHVVHLYEFGDFTRTIAREFTSEDAEAFAKEYNRTSNAHARQAIAAGKDEEAPLSVTPVN